MIIWTLLLAASVSTLPEPVIDGVTDAVRVAVTEAYDASTVGDAESIGYYGMVLLAHHLNDQAEIVFGQAVALAPDNQRWLYLHAFAAHQRGDLAAAAERYGAALAQSPDDPLLHQQRAAALIDLGRLDEASADLDHQGVASYSPANVAALRGRIAYLTGDFELAVERLQTALSITPGATRLHHTLGLALRRVGEVDLARTHLAQAGHIAPGPADPYLRAVRALNRSVQSLIQRGVAMANDGNLEAALRELQSALEVEPDDPSGMATLATVLMEAGRPEEAEVVLTRNIAVNPDHAASYFRLGVLNANASRLDDALEWYRRAIDLNPSYTEANYQIAATLLVMDRTTESVEVLKALAQIHTDNIFIRNQLIIALLADDDCEALDLAIRSRARAPNRGDVTRIYLRALAYCEADEVALEAATRFTARLTATQSTVVMLETYALLLVAAGRDDEALAVLRRALTADAGGPYTPFLERRIAELGAGNGLGEALPAGHPLRNIQGSEVRP
jgi:tetratricopeptide (TPR) repeat protein